jgi:sucrose phosphorylase
VLDLVRLRNTHPAFDGELEVAVTGRSALELTWRAGDDHLALEIDLATARATLVAGDRRSTIAAWRT